MTKGPPGIHQKAKGDQVQEAHGGELPQVQEQEHQKDGGDRPQHNGGAAPPEPTTTEHAIDHYDCGDCGLKGFAPETGLPEEGEYGRNVVVETVENCIDRMPNRRNAEKMTRRSVPMSAGTVHNTVKRAGKALRGPAQV